MEAIDKLLFVYNFLKKNDCIASKKCYSKSAMRARQFSFIPNLPKDHGGSLRPRSRKTARAIDPKQLLHAVLKSSKARGEWSMLHRRHRLHVDEAVTRIAKRYGVRVYRYANVGNHAHLLVKTPSRKAFQRFLKELTGTIALIVTGAKKGAALSKNENQRGFWDQLAYTRIVSWGREFRTVEAYFLKNLFEAAGLDKRGARAAAAQNPSVEDGEMRGKVRGDGPPPSGSRRGTASHAPGTRDASPNHS
jgi:REP element-mobilizing transposase RayT